MAKEQTINDMVKSLSTAEGLIFKSLQYDGAQSQAAIVASANLSQPVVSRALGSLVSQGYARVFRSRDPHSGRSGVKIYEAVIGFGTTPTKRAAILANAESSGPTLTFNLVTKNGETHSVSVSDLLSFVDTLNADFEYTEGQPNELFALLMRCVLTKYNTVGVAPVDVVFIQDKLRASRNLTHVLEKLLSDGNLWTVSGQPSDKFLIDVPDINVETRVLLRKLVLERP